MFNASSPSSRNVGTGMISRSTVRNRAPVKIRSARFISTAMGVEALALILGRRLHPPRLQAMEIITMRAIDDGENLRDRLIKFARDRLPDFSHRKKQSGHRTVFHRGHSVFRRDGLDAQRETIVAFGENDRRLVLAALV